MDVKFTNNLNKVMAKINSKAKEQMVDAVNEVKNTTLETLSGSRSGSQYFVPGTKTLYTASKPGEPPAVATGRLRQSISTKVEGDTGIVGTDIEYGKELEYGTSKVAARPWLRISFEKANIKGVFQMKWF